MPRQLITDNFAVMLVIFDDKDADGFRFALLSVAPQAGGGENAPTSNLYSAVAPSAAPKSIVLRNLPSQMNYDTGN